MDRGATQSVDPTRLATMIRPPAPVAELVDAPDSKSGDGNIVLVPVRPGAPVAICLESGEFSRGRRSAQEGPTDAPDCSSGRAPVPSGILRVFALGSRFTSLAHNFVPLISRLKKLFRPNPIHFTFFRELRKLG
jgi:hypothetical protein